MRKKIIIFSVILAFAVLIIGAVIWYSRSADMSNMAETEVDIKESNAASENEDIIIIQSGSQAYEGEASSANLLSETEMPDNNEGQTEAFAGTGLVRDKDSDSFAKQMELEPQRIVIENIKRNSEDEADGIKDLILLHKFEKTDIALYYYEYRSRELSNYNRVMKRIALEHDGVYQMFNINVSDELLERSNWYGCYDYDNDGELEVAFVLDYNFSEYSTNYYHVLYMFDYNNESGEYEVYGFNIADCMKAVNNGISDYYGIDIEYISCNIIMQFDGGETKRSSVWLDDYNMIEYGEIASMYMYEDGSIEIDMTVKHEIYGLDYMDEDCEVMKVVDDYIAGSLVCKMDYKGNGAFEVSAIGFKEYEH